MRTTAKLREWGSSLGLVVPNETIKKEGLKPGDEVVIEIKRAQTLKDLFGSLQGLNIDAQRMKDEMRRQDARSDAKFEMYLKERNKGKK